MTTSNRSYERSRWKAILDLLAFDRRMWHTYSRFDRKWYAIPGRLLLLARVYVRIVVRGK